MELAAGYKTKRNIAGIAALPEYMYWLAFVLSIMVKCVYFQLTTQLNSKPLFMSENKYMLLSSVGVLIFLTSFFYICFNRRRLTALFVLDLLLTILLAADTNCFRYYYTTISAPVVLNADLRMLGSVNQSIMSLFKLNDVIYILDLPLLLIWAKKLQNNGIENNPFKKRVLIAAAGLLSGFICFSFALKKVKLEDDTFNRNYITKRMGVLYSHYQSLKDYINKNVFEPDTITKKEKDKIQSFFRNRKNSNEGNYAGIAEGSNLIIIQAEALQQFVINRKVMGNEITPNLNSLLEDSLYLDNFYFQTAGGNTSDAEFLCNTSLYPVRDGAVYLRYPSNTYHTLPKALKEQGYNTYVLHGFRPEFYNRVEMYQTLGFDRYFNEEDYEMDDFAGWEGDALSDASFFRQSLDMLDMDKPFYGFFITLSCHHPFKYFKDFDFNVGEFEGSYVGNYLKAVNYADKCLGQFIEQLKEKGLYDNTLLVVYGDHSAVPKYRSDELMNLVGKEYSDFEWARLQKVPFIIHYPGFKNGEELSITGGEIDLFPTIANLMGIEAPYTLGKDLLNAERGYAVLRNGSVITDEYIYLSDRGTAYDAKSGKEMGKSEYQQDLNTLTNELVISDMIIGKNAFERIQVFRD